MFDVKVQSSIRFTTEEVINMAKGKLDQFGKPFTVIEIVANDPGIYHFKTGGYQDTLIRLREGQRMPSITYKHPGKGSLKFLPDKFGGLTGLLAKTPHNMKTLAAELADNKWTIPDTTIRAEVEAIAKTLDPPDEFVEKRRKDAMVDLRHRKRRKDIPDLPEPTQSSVVDEPEIEETGQPAGEEDKGNLNTDASVSLGATDFVIDKRKAELDKMKYQALQKLAAQYKVYNTAKPNRKPTTEAILKHEFEAKEPKNKIEAAVVTE